MSEITRKDIGKRCSCWGSGGDWHGKVIGIEDDLIVVRLDGIGGTDYFSRSNVTILMTYES